MALEPVPGALAVIGGKLAYDVLGPTAKYLGEEMKGLAELGVKNIKRVFEDAKRKEDRLHVNYGSVSPRVLMPLIQSAYYCEDEVVTSYLGGVLCSSRSLAAKDDRAVSIIRTINGLSSYTLRAHCIIYSSLQKQKTHTLTQVQDWITRGHGVTIMFREDELRLRMGFLPEEDADAIMEHAFVSLSANGFSTEGLGAVTLHQQKIRCRWLRPTLHGIELFAWGCGFGRIGISPYFSGIDVAGSASELAIEPLQVDLGMVSYA